MELPPVRTGCDRESPFPRALCLVLAFWLSAFSAPAAARNHHTRPGALVAETMQKNFPAGLPGPDAPRSIAWLCYYGSDREVLALPAYHLLILEADALGPLTGEDRNNRACVAYMSIGEISRNRWFWPLVQDKLWLLEENAEWPDSRRIDPRSREWSDLLVHTIAPALLAAGYDGFMLDNVDIGEYLENRDPDAYAGAKDAVAALIRRLRQAYPEAVIIANGGLETAADVADCLDAVVCESVFSRWRANEDGSFSYAEVSSQDRAWLRPRLLRLRGAGIPVLDLEYVDPEDATARQRVSEAAKKAGYHPYLAERSLMLFPSEKPCDGDSSAKE